MSDITSNNWHAHCAEPELTAAERLELGVLADAINQETLAGSDALVTFIISRTETERDAYIDAELPRSWQAFPARVDVSRRLDRAELDAWRDWLQEAHDADANI